MTQISKKRMARTTMVISAVAIVALCIIWWANGAELEDAWLYVFSIAIILIPAFETYFKSKDSVK